LIRSFTLTRTPSARAGSPPEGILSPRRQSVHKVELQGGALWVHGDLELRQAAAQEVGQPSAAAAVELEAHQPVRGERALSHEAAIRGQMHESAGARGGLGANIENARPVEQDLVTIWRLRDRPRGRTYVLLQKIVSHMPAGCRFRRPCRRRLWPRRWFRHLRTRSLRASRTEEVGAGRRHRAVLAVRVPGLASRRRVGDWTRQTA